MRNPILMDRRHEDDERSNPNISRHFALCSRALSGNPDADLSIYFDNINKRNCKIGKVKFK